MSHDCAGAHCACCGTWIRARPVQIRGRVYGERCAGLVRQAMQIVRCPTLARAADFEQRHPDKIAHARSLLRGRR
jgi:hypothetical protein